MMTTWLIDTGNRRSNTDCALLPPLFQGGMSSLVGVKGEPQEVVALDTFVLPVDRGPAGSDMRLLRSWQYKATGKVAAAAVLAELKAAHLHSGERHRLLWAIRTLGRLGSHAVAACIVCPAAPPEALRSLLLPQGGLRESVPRRVR